MTPRVLYMLRIKNYTTKITVLTSGDFIFPQHQPIHTAVATAVDNFFLVICNAFATLKEMGNLSQKIIRSLT